MGKVKTVTLVIQLLDGTLDWHLIVLLLKKTDNPMDVERRGKRVELQKIKRELQFAAALKKRLFCREPHGLYSVSH